jgi:methionine--tRNA ligase beta chain
MIIPFFAVVLSLKPSIIFNFMINIEDFSKIEIKIGKIISAEKVEGSEKLLKLMIDLGEETPRQILSGVAKTIPEPEKIVGAMVPILVNLAPRMMMGMESQGMMLCADDGQPVLLHPASPVSPGSIVK